MWMVSLPVADIASKPRPNGSRPFELQIVLVVVMNELMLPSYGKNDYLPGNFGIIVMRLVLEMKIK